MDWECPLNLAASWSKQWKSLRIIKQWHIYISTAVVCFIGLLCAPLTPKKRLTQKAASVWCLRMPEVGILEAAMESPGDNNAMGHHLDTVSWSQGEYAAPTCAIAQGIENYKEIDDQGADLCTFAALLQMAGKHSCVSPRWELACQLEICWDWMCPGRSNTLSTCNSHTFLVAVTQPLQILAKLNLVFLSILARFDTPEPFMDTRYSVLFACKT